MKRRDKKLAGFALVALTGTILLFGMVTWFLWRESVGTEQARVADMARTLGMNAEQLVEDAKGTLATLDQLPEHGCSKAHLRAMERAAVKHSYIRAVSYWHAARRLCSVGFLQAAPLMPRRADHIYKSGVIAWWPSAQTEVDGKRLFLMRYGSHELAIDPRMLLQSAPWKGYRIGLWVQGLLMASQPADAGLPEPASLPEGLTVDRKHNQLISRFSLDTIFPIDIVVSEPMSSFWSRYRHTLEVAVLAGLALAALWVYGIWRYGRYRTSLVGELREALRKNRVEVLYQPVIDLSSGQCSGAEALARWRRDDGEYVNQELFIGVAEEVGLGALLTRRVLETVLRELGDLLREHPQLAVNLNLTPDDLHGDGFREFLDASLATAGIEPRGIKLEITERALVNSAEVRALIRTFRQRGHRVAVDDFGTGYSSLSYLQSFELDALKIDKSFVNVIGRQAVTSQVIFHVIEMAKDLGLEIVAEGTETFEQVQWLQQQGVQYGQGFYFSKPLTAPQLCDFIRDIHVKVMPLIPASKHTRAS